MRIPDDPRRTGLALTVASPPEAPPEPPRAPVPYVPWLVAALVWSVAASALGWVLVGALVSVAWLTAVRTTAADVLATIGQGWLAAHGAPATFAGAHVRLTPLGLTLLLVAGCALAAHHAGVQYGLAPDAAPRRRWTAFAAVAGACVAAYLVAGGIVAAVVGSPAQAAAALPGLLLVPLLGASAGALLGLEVDPLEGLPGWVRRLPAAIGVGAGVLAVGSLAAFLVGLVAHWPTVAALHQSLAPDAVGAVLLTLVQAAYLPNLLLAAGSFALGAGVSLGGGAVVSPWVVMPALLPAIPALGAVPVAPGTADWAWLAVGPAAGAASAWWLLRGAAPGIVPNLWQAAVAGVAPAVPWVIASWLAGGDLGAERLRGLGPVFPDLWAWGVLPPAAAGALYGLGRGLWLWRRARAAARESTG